MSLSEESTTQEGGRMDAVSGSGAQRLRRERETVEELIARRRWDECAALLEEGEGLNLCRRVEGRTPLVAALLRGAPLSVIQGILSADPVAAIPSELSPLSVAISVDATTPDVTLAILAANPSAARTERGAMLGMPSCLPLHWAVLRRHPVEVIRSLALANPAACRNAIPSSCRLHATAQRNPHLLVQSRVEVTELPLHFVCRKRGSSTRRRIQDQIKLFRDGLQQRNSQGLLPLHIACVCRQPKRVISMLIAADPSSVRATTGLPGGSPEPDDTENDQGDENPTSDNQPNRPPPLLPLHLVVRDLIQHLHFPAHRQEEIKQVAMQLLRSFPEAVKAPFPAPVGLMALPPLHRLLAAPLFDSVQSLAREVLRLFPEGAQIRGPQRRLPLHLALCSSGPGLRSALLRDLIQAFPDAAQQPDEHGALALHMACRNPNSRDPLVIRQLLDAFPEALLHRDRLGNYPLHALCANIHLWARIDGAENDTNNNEAGPTTGGLDFRGSALLRHFLDANPKAAVSPNESGLYPLEAMYRVHQEFSRRSRPTWNDFAILLESAPEALFYPDFASSHPLLHEILSDHLPLAPNDLETAYGENGGVVQVLLTNAYGKGDQEDRGGDGSFAPGNMQLHDKVARDPQINTDSRMDGEIASDELSLCDENEVAGRVATSEDLPYSEEEVKGTASKAAAQHIYEDVMASDTDEFATNPMLAGEEQQSFFFFGPEDCDADGQKEVEICPNLREESENTNPVFTAGTTDPSNVPVRDAFHNSNRYNRTLLFPLHDFCRTVTAKTPPACVSSMVFAIHRHFPERSAHRRDKDGNLPLHLVCRGWPHDAHAMQVVLAKSLISLYGQAMYLTDSRGDLPFVSACRALGEREYDEKDGGADNLDVPVDVLYLLLREDPTILHQ